MSALARITCCAALVGLSFLAVFATRPAVLTDLGLDPSEWPAWFRDLDRELERHERIRRQFDAFLAAERAKDQVVLGLIAGRLTLAQAARRFCELADCPEEEYRDLLRRPYPAKTSEESLCRHVIAWACKLLEKEPDRQEAVRRRLEEEMRAHLQPSTDGK